MINHFTFQRARTYVNAHYLDVSNLEFDLALNVIGDVSGDKASELLATVLRGGPSRKLCGGDLLPASVAGTMARAVKHLYDLREASAKCEREQWHILLP